MIKNQLLRGIPVALVVLVVASLVISSPVIAGKEKPPQIVIFSVELDFPSQEILLHGVSFDNGDFPEVTLGDSVLAVNSFDAQNLSAALPSGLSEGEYLLTISTGKKTRQFDAYDLTIGAEGEKGETGDKGVQGDPGYYGPAPAMEWEAPALRELRVENPDGTWGNFVDLEGDIGPDGPAVSFSYHEESDSGWLDGCVWLAVVCIPTGSVDETYKCASGKAVDIRVEPERMIQWEYSHPDIDSTGAIVWKVLLQNYSPWLAWDTGDDWSVNLICRTQNL